MSNGYTATTEVRDINATKKIRMTKGVVVKGHPGVSVGDEIDVAWHLADQLVIEGLAEEVKEVKASIAEVIETREPEVEAREPQPKAKGKRSQ